MKYKIGDKVICRVKMPSRSAYEGHSAVADATENDPQYRFQICGANKKANEEEYNYFLQMIDQLPDEVGFSLSELDLYTKNTSNLLDWGISKDFIGMRIIGCFEKNIVDNNNCLKCGSEIKERPLFISTYYGCLC